MKFGLQYSGWTVSVVEENMMRISIACRDSEGTVTAEKCYVTTPNFAFQIFAVKDTSTHKINR